jgi:leucyl-tRNA synthetase
MDYNFHEIEKKWQKYWEDNHVLRVENDPSKPKYYVLDMFPYPSGAGLHVGHPLGYIASDIFSRFKRLKGFNVLHPMGWDAFGLPAEQYAIQTGQHPAITTEQNLARYRSQMDMLGLSYDWSREIKTSDPAFYKWTQWIFLKLFKSWYNNKTKKAETIENLISQFEKSGTSDIHAACGEELNFSAEDWKAFDEKKKSDVLFNYRLAYLSEAWVNWCPALGTVLANDEVKDGVSERGGYPVERKLMPQWSLRMTAYADRLLSGLDTIDWSDSVKEAQRNWIGRSEGCSLQWKIDNGQWTVTVFTTRPDTVFGVTFITLAPENELVGKITPDSHKAKVEEYIKLAKNKTERERQAEVKKVTGEFTGAYAIHPFTGKEIPIWVGDYVLAGYGTGAVMGVPAHDSRDHAFAKHFGLEILQVVEPPADYNQPPTPKGASNSLDNSATQSLPQTPKGASNSATQSPFRGLGPKDSGLTEESYDGKTGKCINSDFLNGLEVKDAIKRAIEEIENRGLGKGKVNFRLRDAAFGRQRYWGEPIPIYYKTVVSGQSSVVSEIPTPLDESELPLILPPIDKFQPTETGDPPLARATEWKYKDKDGKEYHYEYTTMPGWAGSSWYYLRYEDPNNPNEFASKEAINYWQNIDLYIGGAEHATGHLLYFRFWTKFLFDYGLVPFEEPAKKLVNQGMILGNSKIAYRLVKTNTFVTYGVFVNLITCQNDGTDSVQKYDELGINYKELFNANVYDESDRTWGDYKGMLLYTPEKVNIDFVDENDVLDIKKFIEWKPMFAHSKFINQKRGFVCGSEVEKMSKSKWNVVNPDKVIADYGADTMRMYEMFLGPLEMSKPWSTQGISGVYNFLRKFWKMFFREKEKGEREKVEEFFVSDEKPTAAELKILHKTIKKIDEDIERLSFNTSVSAFMICLNELHELKCAKRAILEPLVICLSPFAPHIAEELWSKLGHDTSVSKASYPEFEEKYLIENTFSYPVSFNGKTRFMLELPLNLSKEEIEKEVMNSDEAKKWIKEAVVKKVIVVPNKIVNIVV